MSGLAQKTRSVLDREESQFYNVFSTGLCANSSNISKEHVYMGVVLELEPEVCQALKERAQEQSVSLEVYLVNLITNLSSCTPDNKDLRLLLLTEVGTALRARSEPEHLYTAAALGGFGAVAWGVAALQPEKYLQRALYLRPAGVAALGTLIVALAIGLKIVREHGKFAKIRKEQARIAKELDSLPGAKGIIPKDMLCETAGKGYLWSLAVVAAGAIAAICFCLALLGP